MKRLFYLLLLLHFTFVLSAQVTDLSIEVQAYPTGIISGFQIERSISELSALHLRIGHQFIRHRDLGVQEEERGEGFGFTLGYKRYFKEEHKGFFLSLRSDLWFNTLDWQNNIDQINETSGTTKITVFQPTLQFGFHRKMSNQFFLTPSIAFGYEVNVKTTGAEVGQGAILLLGLQLGKRF